MSCLDKMSYLSDVMVYIFMHIAEDVFSNHLYQFPCPDIYLLQIALPGRNVMITGKETDRNVSPTKTP